LRDYSLNVTIYANVKIMKLIVVESPTKAKTLSGFLGKEYNVQSSFGHIRDLPKGELGIDTEKNFEPTYVVPTKAKNAVTSLKNAAKGANQVILATDEDREGEAIAWHIIQALGLNEIKKQKSKIKNISRIVFHEITKGAILNALRDPRDIDMDLVNAQQTRRILDRLVGYKLSPFLWKKVARGLSAGRVQSVAVRLVADREEEIQKFVPQEYWSIEADLEKGGKVFRALLQQRDNKTIEKLDIKTKKEADAILKNLKGAEYKVESLEQKEVKRNPLPPFTTSTLQQTSWQRLRFPAKLTMQLAQQLYEQGLITYHRTDSLNLSELSLVAAKQYIQKTYETKFWTQRRFKTKAKGAQEAHEAIRPTFPDRTPKSTGLSGANAKLYDIIWRRFLASQMAPVVFDSTAIDIEAKQGQTPLAGSDPAHGAYTFRATGQMLKFDGFLKVYPMKFEETELPSLKKGEALSLKELLSLQHFTQPPARYTEASLIKALEENGIGRPSTYAPILSTVQERGYVAKDEKHRLVPTELGQTVNNLLVEHFPSIVDIGFTADMEKDLDEIAQGKKEWVPMLKEFYRPFEENLQKKYEEVSKKDIIQEAEGKACPECGAPLVVRFGRYGRFYACSKFPECRHTEPLEENKSRPLGIPCPKCKEAAPGGASLAPWELGEVVARRTRKGKTFYGCSRYPKCNYASWQKPEKT